MQAGKYTERSVENICNTMTLWTNAVEKLKSEIRTPVYNPNDKKLLFNQKSVKKSLKI